MFVAVFIGNSQYTTASAGNLSYIVGAEVIEQHIQRSLRNTDFVQLRYQLFLHLLRLLVDNGLAA